MDNSCIDKKIIKQKNREETIKHYVLGYILECAAKNDLDVTTKIMEFLVHDLKAMTDESFIKCLLSVRVNKIALMNATKGDYRKLRKMISVISYSKEQQIVIIHKLLKFAKNFENGFFVNSKIAESNFIDVSPYLWL